MTRWLLVAGGVGLGVVITVVVVTQVRHSRERQHLMSRNEALLEQLPVYPGATEWSRISTNAVTQGDPIAKLVGYLSEHRYAVPAQPQRVHDFYSAWLTARGWRGTDACDAFYRRGEQTLEIISCTPGRLDLRSWLQLKHRKT